jgi:hypothetical protein
MKKENYIELGRTKAIDIDFSLSFPSSKYLVSVNMLIEISAQSLVIPTRMDVKPYKLSAFATYNTDPTGSIDLLKFSLVIYTFVCVAQNYKGKTLLASLEKIIDVRIFGENLTDIIIVFL